MRTPGYTGPTSAKAPKMAIWYSLLYGISDIARDVLAMDWAPEKSGEFSHFPSTASPSVSLILPMKRAISGPPIFRDTPIYPSWDEFSRFLGASNNNHNEKKMQKTFQIFHSPSAKNSLRTRRLRCRDPSVQLASIFLSLFLATYLK